MNAKYPDIPQWAAELADKKIESLNIKKPFVLICNETFSNMNFPDTFYQELTKACRSLGYDVLFNSMTLTGANMYGHTTHSSIAEAMYFAHRARCVIGIRSGLLDILLPYCQSMISVYTPFKERWRFPTVEANRVHAAFTLKKLPVIKPSQLHEIIVDGSMMEREGDNA